MRTWELCEPVELDATVSAGQFLDGVAEHTGKAALPPEVTGPPWARLLPPRGGWQWLADLEREQLAEAAAALVAEFRRRTEALPPQKRTRAELNALAEHIWSRGLAGTPLPLRAVHAAHALGFLRPAATATAAVRGLSTRTVAGDAPVLFSAGQWLRLRTVHGSVAVRRQDESSLSVISPG